MPIRLATLALALLLAACATDSDKAAKPAPLPELVRPVSVRVAWKFDVGSARDGLLQPAVLENAIYAVSGRGNLVRIDPASGKQLWSVRAADEIASGVGSDGSIVVVAGPRGEILAFDAAGKSLWTAQASSDVVAPPLVGHGLVLVRSTDQHISAYELASGKRRWVYLKQEPSLTLRQSAGLVFVDESVLAGFPGGRMVSISLATGAQRWEAGVSEPRGATEVERLNDVLGTPSRDRDVACAASFQGRIACFDAATGDLRWAREFAAGAGAVVSGDRVYGVDENSSVSALSRTAGATIWQTRALAHRQLGPVAVLPSGLVVVADFEGHVHFLSGEDGHAAGRIDADGPLSGPPQTWNGSVVVQTSQGSLLMLSVGP